MQLLLFYETAPYGIIRQYFSEEDLCCNILLGMFLQTIHCILQWVGKVVIDLTIYSEMSFNLVNQSSSQICCCNILWINFGIVDILVMQLHRFTIIVIGKRTITHDVASFVSFRSYEFYLVVAANCIYRNN